MARFIKGRVRLARLTAWLEADARRWVAVRLHHAPLHSLPDEGRPLWADREADAALTTIDAAFAATFGEA